MAPYQTDNASAYKYLGMMDLFKVLITGLSWYGSSCIFRYPYLTGTENVLYKCLQKHTFGRNLSKKSSMHVQHYSNPGLESQKEDFRELGVARNVRKTTSN